MRRDVRTLQQKMAQKKLAIMRSQASNEKKTLLLATNEQKLVKVLKTVKGNNHGQKRIKKTDRG